MITISREDFRKGLEFWMDGCGSATNSEYIVKLLEAMGIEVEQEVVDLREAARLLLDVSEDYDDIDKKLMAARIKVRQALEAEVRGEEEAEEPPQLPHTFNQVWECTPQANDWKVMCVSGPEYRVATTWYKRTGKLAAAAPEAVNMLYEVWSVHEADGDITGEMHARMHRIICKAGANIQDAQ